jgi:hypothetical protein
MKREKEREEQKNKENKRILRPNERQNCRRRNTKERQGKTPKREREG